MAGGVTIKGLDALQKKLKNNMNLKDVQTVVKINGAEMQTKAQRKAPVDKGNLKREISLAITDLGMTAKVTGEVDYDSYQEYGTRFQEGTPHIRPAYKEQKEQFKRDMDKLVK